MSTPDSDQCQALIGNGERCSRPAQDDGYCYQHDESDERVDEAADGGSSNDASDGAGSDEVSPERAASDGGRSESDSSASETAVNTDGSIDSEEESEDESSDTDASDGEGSEVQNSSIMEVRETAQVIGRDLIGHEPDGIIGISSTDDGWQVTIEVVERSSVPDTQDILGRYEIDLDSDYSAIGYRRLDRYRRSDTEREVIE